MSTTAPAQNLNNHQKIRVHVEGFNFDGQPDSTTAISAASTNASNATAAVASDDPRAVDITGVLANTSCNVEVTIAGAPTNEKLIIPINVSAAPNLAHVAFLSADAPTLK
jgi:hypothetical protein